ncbi:MAG: hypothetical protein WA705_05060 [Candidatus Ozemobacteraceae bacterium]
MKTIAKKGPSYSEDTFCGQLHALYDNLEIRRQIILKDPDFNEGNDALMQEMERIVKRIGLIRECFEEFCPS